MAWVRIHDGAMSHPKVVTLSDKAFRLWVWGLSYCQMHLTDGVIPAAAIPPPPRTATVLTLAHLWDAREAGGYQVHDYLDWNDSRELVEKKRREAKERMSNARSRSSPEVRANFYVGVGERGSESDPEKKIVQHAKTLADAVIAEKAGFLLQRYADLFSQYRHGAKLRLIGNSLEFHDACSLVTIWDLPRLEKLAVLVLTTDDPFIAGTDRSFKIFTLKASWADDKLKAWEREHGACA